MVKITEHKYVPKHEKLSKDERKEFLEKYNISIDNLPKISKSDKAIVHLNVVAGDIIKITRPSVTSGESVYYRVVVTKISEQKLDVKDSSSEEDSE